MYPVFVYPVLRTPDKGRGKTHADAFIELHGPPPGKGAADQSGADAPDYERPAPYPAAARPRPRGPPSAPSTPPPSRAIIAEQVQKQVASALAKQNYIAEQIQKQAAPPREAERPLDEQISLAVATALTRQQSSSSGSAAGMSGMSLEIMPAKDAIHATFTIQDTPNVCSKHAI
jgi:hypothetical protein